MLLEKNSLFEKKNRERYVIGYDLNDYAAQISFCSLEGEEPETLAIVAGSEIYNIPVVLFKRPDVNQWFYGREALRNAKEREGTKITDLVSHARKKESVIVEEQEFDPIALLALFMKRSLSLMQTLIPLERVETMVITVDNLDHCMVEVLNKVVETLNLKNIKISFQSHMESFYYYTIYQPQELWKNQVIACDYCGSFFKTYRFEVNRNTKPIVVFIDEQQYLDLEGGRLLKEDVFYEQKAEKREERFLQIMSELFKGRYVSTVFLLGDGFEGDWCKESLRFLCRNRRVFRGNNLFSKGASFAAREKANMQTQNKYVFLGNDKLKCNIGMNLKRRGKDSYLALLDAGQNWFDAKESCDILLESGNSFLLLITPLNGQNQREVEIVLNDLPKRPEKTTRLHIDIRLNDEYTAIIHVKDRGFGEMYPSSGLEWTQEFEVYSRQTQ